MSIGRRLLLGIGGPGALNAPKGTEMVFHQATAPKEWTGTADNDRLLRITTSVGADGGANSINSAATSGGGSSHDHAGSSNHSTHVHTGSAAHSGATDTSGAGTNRIFTDAAALSHGDTGNETATLTHDNTGSESAHTHSIDMDYAFTDCIIASKD